VTRCKVSWDGFDACLATAPCLQTIDTFLTVCLYIQGFSSINTQQGILLNTFDTPEFMLPY
jgi:hypothetical protein